MRTFLVLICTLALACAAGGAQEEKESKKPAPKKQTGGASSISAQPPPAQKHEVYMHVIRNMEGGSGVGSQKTKGSQKVTTAGGHRATVTQPSSVTQKTAGGKPLSTPSSRNLTTNAKPSSEITANAAPPSFVGKSYGVAKQRGAGAGSPAVQLHKFSDTTFKPTTVGRPTTAGALATSPAPKSAVWSHDAGSLKNRPNVKPSGASQGQGKPAKASKNNDQRATPEYHKVWQDGKLPSGGTSVGKPTANAVTGKPTTGQRATYGSNYSSNYGANGQHVQKTKRSQQAAGSPTPKGKPTSSAPFITRIVPRGGAVTEHGVTNKPGHGTRSHETVTAAGKPKTTKSENVSPAPIPR